MQTTPTYLIAQVLDVRGYNCPIPLLRTKKALAGMLPGEVIEVLTTDPGAEIDFRVYAETSGNALLTLQQMGSVWKLHLQKQMSPTSVST
jgi:tRNA 2-thiouridine synthesizing protein A